MLSRKPLVLLLILTITLTGFSQKYQKDLKRADEAYAAKNYFDAIDLYKKAFTDKDAPDKDKQKPSDNNYDVICKIADCYRNLGDNKQEIQWYTKGIKCGCMDSTTGKQYIAAAQARIANDTLYTRIWVPDTPNGNKCDDCPGHWVLRLKRKDTIPATAPKSGVRIVPHIADTTK